MANMLEQAEVMPAASAADPMLPAPYRIQRVRQETDDTFTLEILPEDSRRAFSLRRASSTCSTSLAWERTRSISSDPDDVPLLKHTTRVVGTVTKAMRRLKRGEVMGIRGPLGVIGP